MLIRIKKNLPGIHSHVWYFKYQDKTFHADIDLVRGDGFRRWRIRGKVKGEDNSEGLYADSEAAYELTADDYVRPQDAPVKSSNSDPVNSPSHYTTGTIEVINFIEDKQLNYHRGNAVKYIIRSGIKDKDKEVEDLEKAIWYLRREIERLKREPKQEEI